MGDGSVPKDSVGEGHVSATCLDVKRLRVTTL